MMIDIPNHVSALLYGPSNSYDSQNVD